MSSKERKAGLDVIRSVAIVAVLLCHFLGYYLNIRGRWSYTWGVLGVELFFVLSGYLIGGILIREMLKPGPLRVVTLLDFWIRRWTRTIPNYLLFLAIVWWMMGPIEWSTLANYLTFTQNFVAPMGQFFHISWSLAIEEWFYLLFPAVIFGFGIFTRSNRSRFIAAVSFLFLVSIVARLALGPGRLWDDGIRKVVVMRMDAIMWGVMVALLERTVPNIFARLQTRRILWLGVAILLATFIGLIIRYPRGAEDFTATWADTFWFFGFSLGGALLIPYSASRLQLWKPVEIVTQRISLWSYSMYLSHLLVMILVSASLDGVLPWPLHPFIAAAGIIGVSAGLYHYFEAPLTRLREPLCRNLLGRSVHRKENP